MKYHQTDTEEFKYLDENLQQFTVANNKGALELDLDHGAVMACILAVMTEHLADNRPDQTMASNALVDTFETRAISLQRKHRHCGTT